MNNSSGFDATTPMADDLVIYHPRTNPIRGLASAKTSSLVPPGSGYFSNISNYRWGDDGVLTVRSGIPDHISGVIRASSTVRGLFTGTFNGNPSFAVSSFKNASHRTQIFLQSSSLATWTDITPTTGKYNDTTLGSDGGNNDYETTFQIVHDRWRKLDLLVIQNGYDYPRVYDGTTTAVHLPVNPPTRSSKWGAVLTWRSYFVFSDRENTTYDNSGATNFSLADTAGSDGDHLNVIRLAQGASAPSGTATVSIDVTQNYVAGTGLTAGTTLDATNSRQLAFVVRPKDKASHGLDHFLSNYKISVKGAGTTIYPLYDPTNPIRSGSLVPADDSTATWILGLFTDDVAAADLGTLGTIQLDAISGAVAPDAAYDLDFYCIASTGMIPGNCSYALSYMNLGSGAESYEQVIPTLVDQIDNLQGATPKSSAPMNHLTVVNTQELFFQVNIFFQNTTDAERDLGTDFLRVYRKQLDIDPSKSETEYTHSFSVDIARWTGSSWVYTNTTAGLDIRTTVDNTAPEDRDLWLTSPGAFQEPIPIARTMSFAGNRLLCGARTSQEVDSFPSIQASKASFPLRFSSLAFNEDDPSDPLVQELPGDNIQAFVTVSVGGLGESTVYVFTDRAVWLLNMAAAGTPAVLTRLVSIGTGSPFSIVEHLGNVYFLDSDRQVLKIQSDGSLRTLSRGIVDDKTTGIPLSRTRAVRSVWANNRYYMFYTPSGGTVNNHCLLFSEHADAWESDDVIPNIIDAQGAEAVMTWISTTSAYGTTSDRRIIFIGSDLQAYRFESPGTTADLGSAIATDLMTGDAFNPDWEGFTVKGIGILCEDQNDRKIQCDATYKPTPDGVQSFLVSMDALNTNVYRYGIQRDSLIGSVPAHGIAASFHFFTDQTGEKSILGLYAEMEAREMFAPAAG